MNPSDLDPGIDYIFTIGHSNTPFEVLLENLRAYEIEALVDVRSQPASRFAPQYSRGALAATLQSAGIDYAFMGHALGGRPPDASMYDTDGHVRYDLWSASNAFNAGIDSLLTMARGARIALMCSEEDPAQCHRHLLIARVLRGRGVDPARIIHIRKTGDFCAEAAFARQGDLLAADWWSPMPLAHKVRRISSAPR